MAVQKVHAVDVARFNKDFKIKSGKFPSARGTDAWALWALWAPVVEFSHCSQPLLCARLAMVATIDKFGWNVKQNLNNLQHMYRIDLDLSQLKGMGEGIEQRALEASRAAAAELSSAIHAHLVEQASEKLHSRRPAFLEALKFKQVNQDVYVVSLDAKAKWIDEGSEPHDMKDALLKSPKAKTSKSGSRYLSIPFHHGPGKGSSSTTPAEQSLISTLKTAMKKMDIPFGKIEKHPDGSPKQGLLHKFDIMDNPIKTKEGPGQGRGPIGQVKQGSTGIPLLQGVRVYQRTVKGKTTKSIMTFRTVSSNQGGDKWMHPGLAPTNLMDEAYEWGLSTWENKILPKILDRVMGLNLIA